jgi:uncharacterized membrane protein
MDIEVIEMDMKNIKLLGGIGVLLAVLSVIPDIGIFAGIAGLVLVFIAINELSKLTKNKAIYNNFLVSFILGIVGSVLSGLLIIGNTVGRFLRGSFYEGYMLPYRRYPNFDFGRGYRGLRPFNEFGTRLGNANIGVIIALVVFGLILYGMLVARSYYLKKSYDEIAKETGVEHFKTAGNLMFIGSIFSIVLVGFVVYFIGYIFEVIAYFSLPDNLEAKEEATPPPLPQ